MRGHAADPREHIPHQRTVADNALKLALAEQFIFQARRAPLPRALEQFADALPQSDDGNRLVEIVRTRPF